MPSDAVPFSGFSPAAMQFLRDLAEHNDREWFRAHRDVYETELQIPLGKLVVRTAEIFGKAGLPLRGDPKRSVFRIHRDTRFSPDKRPYKTHVSAVFDRNLTRGGDGILYIHIDPAGSFAALAFYRPSLPKLTLLREAIVDKRVQFLKALDHLRSRALELSRDEEALKRTPRGFEEFADSEVSLFLKYRSFIIRRSLAEESVRLASLPEALLDFTLAGLPFLKFGWEALDR
jgi:uncharacterized protein (TIGR02453 family)